MEKVIKSNCSCVSWCFCYVCLINVLIFCFLIVKELNQDWLKIVIYVALFVINLVCVIVANIKILSEKDDSNIKLEQVITEYKAFVRSELKCLSNNSFNKDEGLSKTLEMITETFNDKNCDDAKLKTLQVVIDAVIKSHEAERQIKSNSE